MQAAKMLKVESMAGAEMGWLWQKFWAAYLMVDALPDACPFGFLTTCAAAIVLMPVILYSALCMVWSLAQVGRARKSMSSVFIVLLGIPLYPILSALLMALLWVSVRVVGLACVTLGPVALVAFVWGRLIEAKTSFIEHQQTLEPDVQDITCWQMLLGLVVGVCSLCTAGLLTAVCSLLKAPLLIVVLFCRAWAWFVQSWLELVGCCQRRDAESPSSSDSDSESQVCCLWAWFPIILAAWIVAVLLGTCLAVLGVGILMVIELLASTIYPAYITSGWLRYAGGRRRYGSTCLALKQGLTACVQVCWTFDVGTNMMICQDFSEYRATLDELAGAMRGSEAGRCSRLSCLPRLDVGLADGSWDFALQEIARQLGLGSDEVDEAWRSLARQMIVIGRGAIENGWFSRDWVSELPAELCLGLPARTLLDTIERSSSGALRMSSGLVINEQDRPRGQFFDEIWQHFTEAKNARAQVQVSEEEHRCLEAMLLAGGGGNLPEGLAAVLAEAEAMPPFRLEALRQVQRPLMAISILLSRKSDFKDRLQVVINGITCDDAEDYLRVIHLQTRTSSESE